MKITIISKREGFRRAGRPWSEAPTTVDVSDFTEEQLKALASEAMLIVSDAESGRVLSIAAATGDASSASAGAGGVQLRAQAEQLSDERRKLRQESESLARVAEELRKEAADLHARETALNDREAALAQREAAVKAADESAGKPKGKSADK